MPPQRGGSARRSPAGRSGGRAARSCGAGGTGGDRRGLGRAGGSRRGLEGAGEGAAAELREVPGEAVRRSRARYSHTLLLLRVLALLRALFKTVFGRDFATPRLTFFFFFFERDKKK